ncbi:NAD-glutamate dehydrogenase [Streptomyces narbonensis]
MLLSEHIRLIAAFDHRHIFIDPNPDAAVSYAERRRLFDLPRSSWADYDTSLLSAGGGIHPRSARTSIPVDLRAGQGRPRHRGRRHQDDPGRADQGLCSTRPSTCCGTAASVRTSSPSAESNADVGDKANDAIRVDGQDVRAQVIGEGGNLGATQLGRIEFARTGGPEGIGGKVNTDAIDNSAGVDTSDHEVNIKILLGGLVAEGDMTVKQRNKILAEMTDEVGTLVLRNNYAQNTALANAVAQSPSLLHAHQRFMRRLGRDGSLDRSLEFLPNDRQIRELLNNSRGLSQPELAVLLAYTKITVADELIGTELPDDPYLRGLLHVYLPAAAREVHRGSVDNHALRREIITTVLVNDTVNTGGSTFLHRLREETGASIEEIVRAQTRGPCGLPPRPGLGRRRGPRQPGARRRPDPDAAALPPARRARHPLAARETGRSRCRSAKPSSSSPTGWSEVWGRLPELLRGADLEWYQSIVAELTEVGVPEELALAGRRPLAAFPILDIVAIADRTDKEPLAVAEV